MKYQCLSEECGRVSSGYPVWKEDDEPTYICAYCQEEVMLVEAEKTYPKKTKREKLDELSKEELIERLIRAEEKSGRRKREIRNMNRALFTFKKIGTLQNRLLLMIEETKDNLE